jgi:hypothetical protein
MPNVSEKSRKEAEIRTRRRRSSVSIVCGASAKRTISVRGIDRALRHEKSKGQRAC